MDGYFKFRYLRPGEIGCENEIEQFNEAKPNETFKVYVSPMRLGLTPGAQLVPNPAFEPYMNYL